MDNAQRLVFLIVQQKLIEFGGDVLLLPKHSLDIMLSNFRLFCSLPKSLNIKNFNSLVEINCYVENVFTEKPERDRWHLFYLTNVF